MTQNRASKTKHYGVVEKAIWKQAVRQVGRQSMCSGVIRDKEGENFYKNKS